MRYKNPDPFEKNKAQEIIEELIELCDETIKDCVKRNFYNRPQSIIARELRYDVYQGIANAFNKKSLEINFDDTGSNVNTDGLTTEYDKFWNDVVIHDTDPESVKNAKMQLQDKLRGTLDEYPFSEFQDTEEELGD